MRDAISDMTDLEGAPSIPYTDRIRIVRVLRLRTQQDERTMFESPVLQRARIVAHAGDLAVEHLPVA